MLFRDTLVDENDFHDASPLATLEFIVGTQTDARLVSPSCFVNLPSFPPPPSLLLFRLSLSLLFLQPVTKELQIVHTSKLPKTSLSSSVHPRSRSRQPKIPLLPLQLLDFSLQSRVCQLGLQRRRDELRPLTFQSLEDFGGVDLFNNEREVRENQGRRAKGQQGCFDEL